MSIQSVESDRTTMVVESDVPPIEPRAEVVVKGRNVEIPDHFRAYVAEKLARLERFDRTIYLFDVELDTTQPSSAQELPARRDHGPRKRVPSRAARPAPTASTRHSSPP